VLVLVGRVGCEPTTRWFSGRAIRRKDNRHGRGLKNHWPHYGPSV